MTSNLTRHDFPNVARNTASPRLRPRSRPHHIADTATPSEVSTNVSMDGNAMGGSHRRPYTAPTMNFKSLESVTPNIPIFPAVRKGEESVNQIVERSIFKTFRPAGFESQRVPDIEHSRDAGMQDQRALLRTPPQGSSYVSLGHNELLAQYKILSQSDFSSMNNFEKNETYGKLQGICHAFHLNYLRVSAELGLTQEKLSKVDRDVTESRSFWSPEDREALQNGLSPDESVVSKLEGYLKKIEREIMENDSVEDPDKEVIRQTLASRVLPSSLKTIYVVDNILKSFDDLIFIMKKRLNRYEKESTKLKDVVDRFGNIESLLAENDQLKKENAKLRFREERIAADSLLERPSLQDCSLGYLRTLVICLQNELMFHKRLLDKYNIARNPCLGLLVTSPAPEIQLSSAIGVLDLINQKKFKMTFPELLDTETTISPPPYTSHTMESLMAECELLRNKVARLEKFQVAEGESSTPNQMGANRRKTLRQIQDEKAKEARENQAALTDKEKTIEVLTKQVQDLKSEKDKLAENTTELSYLIVTASPIQHNIDGRIHAIIHHRKQNKDLRRHIQELFTVLRTLHLSNVALATQKNGVSENQAGQVLRNVYGEMLSMYIQYTAAAVKLQSWFRGCRSRKVTTPPKPTKPEAAGFSERGKTPANTKSKKKETAPPKVSNLPPQPHVNTSMNNSLLSRSSGLSEEIMGSTIKSLNQLVLRGHELDTLFLCRLPMAIQQARLEMIAAARHHIICLQRGWEEQMKRYSADLIQAVRIADKPAIQRASQATQTPLPNLTTVATQYDPNYYEDLADDSHSINSSTSFANTANPAASKAGPVKKKR